MPRIYVEFAGFKQIGGNCKTVSYKVATIQSGFQRTVQQLDWDIKYESDIKHTASQIAQKLEQYSKDLEGYQRFLDDAYNDYVNLDAYKRLLASNDMESIAEPAGKFEIFKDEFGKNYGWKELLSGAGSIGEIYNLANDIKNGKTWFDLIGSGKKVYKFLNESVKNYNNYKKIGNAVGTKKAMQWWLKDITGLKSLGRASAAKNPFTRFVNNLTNKTSPFNAQFKEVVSGFTGKGGIGKAVASWGSVALSGVSNWFSNKEEQASSKGTMSEGRVIAETVTETAVDTALTYGAGIVAGAAVTTALGTVAAPAIVVTALSGMAVVAFNSGVKAITGKTTTEWISDGILDAGEAIGSAVGSAAKNVSKSIGNWFKKLSFT